MCHAIYYSLTILVIDSLELKFNWVNCILPDEIPVFYLITIPRYMASPT